MVPSFQGESWEEMAHDQATEEAQEEIITFLRLSLSISRMTVLLILLLKQVTQIQGEGNEILPPDMKSSMYT